MMPRRHHSIYRVESSIGRSEFIRTVIIKIKVNIDIGTQLLAPEVKLDLAPALTDPTIILGFNFL
jgi:hypothetical protein